MGSILSYRQLVLAPVMALALLGSVAAAQTVTQMAMDPSKGDGLKPPSVTRAKPDVGPGWMSLSSDQRAALHPLAGVWPTLTAAQKRKWISLSKNYPKMKPSEQALMHSRMSSWSALTPAQRAQARLNFSESRALQADERKAHWEAYQALSPEQKKELARQRAAQRPAGTEAAPAGAVSPQGGSVDNQGKPRRSVARNLLPHANVDANTLLPQAPEVRK